MKRLIFATGNQDKMREIREILAGDDVEVLSLKDLDLDVDIVEDGSTFEENAAIKAKTICKMTGEIVLADDSGLEIDYLNKEPGIYSARYMGENTSYVEKNANLIGRLEGVPDEKRTARFVCAIAAAFPDGSVRIVREPWKAVLVMKQKEKMDLAMIPFSICRNTAALPLSFPGKKRIESVTEARRFGQ